MTINLTLRGTKGSTLTYQEVDSNFTSIKTAVDSISTVDTSSFVTTSSLSTQLTNYVTSSSLSTQLTNYVTSSSLSTQLQGYVTTTTNQTISGAKTLQNATLKAVNETVYAWGNTSAGTYTIDATSGTIHSMTLTGAVTINAFTNPVAGQAVTLKITQDATGSRTLTSTMKFAGASKTLTTSSNAIDIVNILYDGSAYLASLVKGFA
jgi:hypothetical protein